jgi:hypothetical protein
MRRAWQYLEPTCRRIAIVLWWLQRSDKSRIHENNREQEMFKLSRQLVTKICVVSILWILHPGGEVPSLAKDLKTRQEVRASVEWSCGQTQTRQHCEAEAKEEVLKRAIQNYKTMTRSFQKVKNYQLEADVIATVAGGYIYGVKYSTRNIGVNRFRIAATGYVIPDEIDYYIEKFLQEKGVGSCPSGMSYIPYVRPFCIDKFEYPNKSGQMPKNKVSWFEAKNLCEAQGKYLCSEGQWQKACEGPHQLTYPYGEMFDSTKCRSAKGKTVGPSPSGNYLECKSGFEVFDMSGNLREWTDSNYDEAGVKKVLRGGDWSNQANRSNCEHRHYYPPTDQYSNFGFRCCKKPK